MMRVYTKEVKDWVHVIVLSDHEYTQLQDLLKRDVDVPFAAALLARIVGAAAGREDDEI